MVTTDIQYNTKDMATAAAKKMKIGQLSITVNTRFALVRRSRADYHLCEIGGDWLCYGTIDEVIDRAFQ